METLFEVGSTEKSLCQFTRITANLFMIGVTPPDKSGWAGFRCAQPDGQPPPILHRGLIAD